MERRRIVEKQRDYKREVEVAVTAYLGANNRALMALRFKLGDTVNALAESGQYKTKEACYAEVAGWAKKLGVERERKFFKEAADIAKTIGVEWRPRINKLGLVLKDVKKLAAQNVKEREQMLEDFEAKRLTPARVGRRPGVGNTRNPSIEDLEKNAVVIKPPLDEAFADEFSCWSSQNLEHFRKLQIIVAQTARRLGVE
jgi:hypothetical protein